MISKKALKAQKKVQKIKAPAAPAVKAGAAAPIAAPKAVATRKAARPSRALAKPPVRPPAAIEPEPEEGSKDHYWWYAAAFVLAGAIFAVAAALALTHKATGWEYTWFRELNTQPNALYRLMQAITFLGNTWMAAIVVGFSFILRFYRLAWRMAVTIIGAYGVVFVAKHLIDRARPGELFDQVHVRMAEDGMGFPSGHVTLVTVIALTLVPYLPWKLRWVLPILIVAVAISRLYLGVHIPLDLVGGLAIGTAAVSFIRILPKRVRLFLKLT